LSTKQPQHHGEPRSSAKRAKSDISIEPTPLSSAGPPPRPMPFSPLPTDYPFFFEQNRWICKFCAHIPPPYREPQYCWANQGPPPPQFVDYHLSICREYQKNVMYEQQQQYAASSPSPYPTPGWDQRPIPGTPSYPRTPDAAASPYATPSYGGNTAPKGDEAGIVATPLLMKQQPVRPLSSTDTEARLAIDHLEANDMSKLDNDGNPVPEADILVLDEDRLLLTEYFYYLMKQLRVVRFSESDRRTRGGKREKIKIGYGGLQCVHCVDIPNTRKFFWSNVDRLANSFAEIPTHVLKCRRCPQPTKDALLLLKKRHADQMSRLPRGSQKVFFRRMWRRLHEKDPNEPDDPVEYASTYPASPVPYPAIAGPPRPSPVDTKQPRVIMSQVKYSTDVSPAGTSGSDESVYFLQRPAKEAAKALVDSSMQHGPPTPSSRVLLAIPEDKEWLSDTDCFIRRQLEVFCATEDDVDAAVSDRKYPVQAGQVGIRCIHCALTKEGANGQAVAYPFSISGIYEAAREFQRLHLENCENLPLSAKTKLVSLKGSSSLSSVLRKYFVLAAKALGLRDTVSGIQAGAESVPLGSQAAFAFSDSTVADELKQLSSAEKAPPPSSQKKRKGDSPEGTRESKRPAVSAYDRMSMLAAASVGASETPARKPRPPSSEDDPEEKRDASNTAAI
jgi:hypothetical protein